MVAGRFNGWISCVNTPARNILAYSIGMGALGECGSQASEFAETMARLARTWFDPRRDAYLAFLSSSHSE